MWVKNTKAIERAQDDQRPGITHVINGGTLYVVEGIDIQKTK